MRIAKDCQKVVKVIESCKTKEQLMVACSYARVYFRYHGLWDIGPESKDWPLVEGIRDVFVSKGIDYRI